MCFVFIWEKTATCATCSINWLVFIAEMKSVYSAVRTASLNKAVCAYVFKAYWSHDAPSSLTFNNCTFCPHCIYVFFIYLRTNSDLCHLHHKLIGFYNWDEKCLLRGTNWAFVFISKQTATYTTYIINRLVFITEMKSVYSAVRTGTLKVKRSAIRLLIIKYIALYIIFY